MVISYNALANSLLKMPVFHNPHEFSWGLRNANQQVLYNKKWIIYSFVVSQI